MNFDQKLESNNNESIKTPENKIKDGVAFVFEQNPELAQIGSEEQYSEYLDTIFPDSKIKDIVYHGAPQKFDKFDLNLAKDTKAIFFTKNINETFYNEIKIAAMINIIGDGLTEEGKISDVLLNMIKEKFLKENNISFMYTVHELTDFINKYYEHDVRVFKASTIIKFDNFLRSDFNRTEKRLEDYLKDFNITGRLVNDTMINIFDSEQIQILGIQKDIENFRKFVSKKVE